MDVEANDEASAIDQFSIRVSEGEYNFKAYDVNRISNRTIAKSL